MLPTARAPRRTARTIFDLTPEELRKLEDLDSTIAAMSPAPSMRLLGTDGDTYDRDAYDSGHNALRIVRTKRSLWLKEHRISQAVARQARITSYDPYSHADRINLAAPILPESFILEKIKSENKIFELKNKIQTLTIRKINLINEIKENLFSAKNEYRSLKENNFRPNFNGMYSTSIEGKPVNSYLKFYENGDVRVKNFNSEFATLDHKTIPSFKDSILTKSTTENKIYSFIFDGNQGDILVGIDSKSQLNYDLINLSEAIKAIEDRMQFAGIFKFNGFECTLIWKRTSHKLFYRFIPD